MRRRGTRKAPSKCMVAPSAWLVTWVESGQNLSEGHPLRLALLALLFSHSTHKAGRSGESRLAGGQPLHSSVETGGGALWGAAGAELHTLPRTGVLVFICRVHCDFFLVDLV